MVTLVATWPNGVQKTFPHQDSRSLAINKAEIEILCEENNFTKPVFEEIPEDDRPAIPNELTQNFGDIEVRRQLMALYGDSKTAYSGVNEEGEDVLVSIAKDSIVVVTNQKNGWVRKNFYDEAGYHEGETFDGRWK